MMSIGPRVVVVVVALAGGAVGLHGPAAAAEAGPASAPWLGPGVYSIHTSGDLDAVLEEVKAVTGLFVVREGPHQLAGPKVTLDMDDATLGEIMLEVGRQAGMVFERLGGGRAVRLRPGDVKVDPRPAADLEEFVVYAEQVCITDRRTTTLQWGEAEPRGGVHSELTVRLAITPKSPEFMDTLAGISRFASVVTDAGEVLEVPKPPDTGQGPMQSMMVLSPTASPETAGITLPAPRRAAGTIERLEGRLLSYSQSKLTQMNLEPREGATAAEDDVTGTLQTWNLAGNTLTLALRVTYPPLSADAAAMFGGRTDEVDTAVILKDGTTLRSGGVSMRGSSEGGRKVSDLTLTYRLDDTAPVEVDRVEVSVGRRGGALLETPFVIEGIPLPPEAE